MNNKLTQTTKFGVLFLLFLSCFPIQVQTSFAQKTESSRGGSDTELYNQMAGKIAKTNDLFIEKQSNFEQIRQRQTQSAQPNKKTVCASFAEWYVIFQDKVANREELVGYSLTNRFKAHKEQVIQMVQSSLGELVSEQSGFDKIAAEYGCRLDARKSDGSSNASVRYEPFNFDFSFAPDKKSQNPSGAPNSELKSQPTTDSQMIAIIPTPTPKRNDDSVKKNAKIGLKNAALLKSITECEAKKDYACVVELAAQGITSNPADARFYYKRGEGLADLNRFDESLADLTKALDIDPKSKEVLFFRAIVYELTRKYENAAADYRKVVENAPTDENYLVMGKALNRIAIEKMKCGVGDSAFSSSDCAARLNEAVNAFTQGIKLTPEVSLYMFLDERAKSYRAISRLGIDKKKEAKADEEKAAANFEKTATDVSKKLEVLNKQLEEKNSIKRGILVFLKQGNECLGKKDYVCTIQIINEGLKQYPGAAELLALRGVALLLQGKTDEAISDFTKSIEADPKSSNAFYDRGVAYGNIYDYDKALADFTRAIDLNSNFKSALLRQADLLTLQGQYENAEADLRKVIELEPENKPAADNLNLIMTLKEAKFNTGKIKEDTLLKYREYKEKLITAEDVFNGNITLVKAVIDETPVNKPKICSAISNYLNPPMETIETNRAKIQQIVDDRKLDKLLLFNNEAVNLLLNSLTFRVGRNEAAATYGCR